MEIFLNLAWAGLALLLVVFWLRSEKQTGADRRRQIIAIAVLIAILFPVISVSDDLMAVQNATETDSLQRRDHIQPSGHPPLLPVALFAAVLFQEEPSAQRRTSPVKLEVRAPEHPELAGIDNRPPPPAV